MSRSDRAYPNIHDHIAEGGALYQRMFSAKTEPAPSAPSSQIQVGGDHYCSKSIQPWDAMAAWMTPEEFAGFLRGNAIKYLARCNDKGGVEDMKKARHYLDKLIEVSE